MSKRGWAAIGNGLLGASCAVDDRLVDTEQPTREVASELPGAGSTVGASAMGGGRYPATPAPTTGNAPPPPAGVDPSGADPAGEVPETSVPQVQVPPTPETTPTPPMLRLAFAGDGLGSVEFFDPKRIVAHPNLSLASGAIRGWDKRNAYYFSLIQGLAEHYGFDVNAPFEELPAKVGEHAHYGMGLMIENRYDITSISHGGSLFGFKSQMYWLPEHAVGAVVLTNSDEGGALMNAFYRYWLELLFDGKPEAVEDLQTAARTTREWLAKERQRLTLPPAQEALQALAPRYRHPQLGVLEVRREASGTRVIG